MLCKLVDVVVGIDWEVIFYEMIVCDWYDFGIDIKNFIGLLSIVFELVLVFEKYNEE